MPTSESSSTPTSATASSSMDVSNLRRLELKHSGSVTSIRFAPDGTSVVAGFSTGDVLQWSPQTEVVRTTRRHTGAVHSVDFSPDSKHCISAGADGTIQRWASRMQDADAKVFNGHLKTVWMVRYSADGTWFASCSADSSVRVWNAGTGACVCVFKEHSATVTHIACGGVGVDASSTAPDTPPISRSVSDEDAAVTSGAHPRRHRRLRSDSFRNDTEQLLASASWDNSVVVYDVGNKTTLHRLDGHMGNVTCLAFSKDNALLVSASTDCTLRVWHPTQGHCFEVFQDHAADVTHVALQDSHLVSGDADGNVWRMNIMTGKIFPVRSAHGDAVTSIAFSPDTSVIATASRDASVGLWDVLSDELIYRLKVPDGSEIASMCFSPDGTKVVAGTKAGNTVVWDLYADQHTSKPLTRSGSRGSAKKLQATRSGRRSSSSTSVSPASPSPTSPTRAQSARRPSASGSSPPRPSRSATSSPTPAWSPVEGQFY
eukprot:m.602711 g.602711  ORF g.602711 m.602711 type:complete len:487 (+) comp22450_c0_seq6:283-1743(+)